MINAKPFAEIIEFKGLACVRFGAAGYEAIAALFGGNVISLKYVPKNMELLRTPAKLEDYLLSTQTHGASPLFPPNRICGGSFTFEGRQYHFPVNRPHGMHMHGFVKDALWNLDSAVADGEKAVVTLSYDVDENNDIYGFFGHRFHIILENTLSKDGLVQRLTMENKEEFNMPFGFAYHTAFKIPFNTSPENGFSVQANLLKTYEMNLAIPTGKLLELAPRELAISGEGFGCMEEQLDCLYLADPERLNKAVITDAATGDKVVYESGSEFHHWILYNKDAKSGFLCIEPQTWCNNAPNTTIQEANVMTIAPKSAITLTTKIYAE